MAKWKEAVEYTFEPVRESNWFGKIAFLPFCAVAFPVVLMIVIGMKN